MLQSTSEVSSTSVGATGMERKEGRKRDHRGEKQQNPTISRPVGGNKGTTRALTLGPDCLGLNAYQPCDIGQVT